MHSKTLFLVLVLVLSMGMSCSSGGSDSGGATNPLVGTWNRTAGPAGTRAPDQATFNADGSGRFSGTVSGNATFTWTLSGNQLTVRTTGDPNPGPAMTLTWQDNNNLTRTDTGGITTWRRA